NRLLGGRLAFGETSTTDQSRHEEHHQSDLENFQEISFLALLMSFVLSNAKRQRREPATDDVRFGSERHGWLRFAPPTSARCISYDAKLFRRTLWPNHGELLAIDSTVCRGDCLQTLSA